MKRHAQDPPHLPELDKSLLAPDSHVPTVNPALKRSMLVPCSPEPTSLPAATLLTPFKVCQPVDAPDADVIVASFFERSARTHAKISAADFGRLAAEIGDADLAMLTISRQAARLATHVPLSRYRVGCCVSTMPIREPFMCSLDWAYSNMSHEWHMHTIASDSLDQPSPGERRQRCHLSGGKL